MISKLQKPLKSGFNQKTEPDQILNNVDLFNKNIIITGGYSGIGLETTKALKSAGARVIIPAKRQTHAQSLLANIVPEEDIYEMNLADLKSVSNFVESFSQLNIKLDILINNAGIMACPETRVGNNWESQFGINHIGHQVLVTKLMNNFRVDGNSRFISLSSSAHSISKIQWDDIHFINSPYNKWAAYGQSKTASSLLAIEFDKKMKDKGVRGFAVHPGGILTPLQRHLENKEMVALGWKKEDGSLSDLAAKFFKSSTQGASTTLWCAVSKQLKDIGGVFCENCDIAERKKFIDKSQQRYFGVADYAIDSEEAEKLWNITEEMISRH